VVGVFSFDLGLGEFGRIDDDGDDDDDDDDDDGQSNLPDRNAEAAHLGAQEPVLGRDARRAASEGPLVVFGVIVAVDEEVCEDAEEDAEADSEEREAVLPGVEAVDGLEGVGVSGEEGEKDGEGEGRVKAEEEDGRLGGEHVQWTQQGDGREHFPVCQAGEFCLGWWGEVEPFGPGGQDDFLVGFRHAHYWEEGGQ